MENVVCRMDEVVFGLKAPFDFGFLRKYGRVFKVFDDQDSGNICFGVEKDGVRRFVKFVGAPTKRGGIAPEEFELGAALDEVTNVYTLGAKAFALFADGVRSRESWPLGEASYRVAAQAVCPERSGRQQSIREFMEAWRAAL